MDLLLNEIELMREVAAGRPVIPAEQPDPVCGVSVGADEAALEASFDGSTYRFCSDTCRQQFLQNPTHYARPRHVA
jgi:YHS domain-containing protein